MLFRAFNALSRENDLEKKIFRPSECARYAGGIRHQILKFREKKKKIRDKSKLQYFFSIFVEVIP